MSKQTQSQYLLYSAVNMSTLFLLTNLSTPAQDDVPDEVFLQGEEGAAY